MKIQKKKIGVGGGGRGSGGGGGSGWEGQGICERRSEVFVKMKKKYIFFFLGGEGSGWGGQGGCERRIEVFERGVGVRWGLGWWGRG